MMDILDVNNLKLEGDFDEQVSQILDFVRLTREDVQQLSQIYNDIADVLQIAWPDCTVTPFGSVVTGLAIKTSDADCYVHTFDGYVGKEDLIRKIIHTKRLLGRYPMIFQKLFAITQAKVPIVQFYHCPTGTSGDISFSSEIAVVNSNLIRHLLTSDPRAMKLAILIKYWSKVHKLTGTNLLPNYALILLILFYLQQVDILPSVRYLQELATKRRFINGWEVSFDEMQLPLSQNNMPLHQLLGGFFSYYTKFNFKEMFICPYLGYPIDKKSFAMDAAEFNVYKSNLENGYCQPLQTNRVCVQDPFQHDRNCTVAVHEKLAFTVNAYMLLAAKIYDQDSGSYESLLMRILSECPAIPQVKRTVPPGRVMKRGRGIQRGRNQPHAGHQQSLHKPPLSNRHTPAFRMRGRGQFNGYYQRRR